MPMRIARDCLAVDLCLRVILIEWISFESRKGTAKFLVLGFRAQEKQGR